MQRHGHVEIAVIVLAGLIGAAAGAGAALGGVQAAVEPTFAAKPSAVRDGGGMKISFAASAGTDVHVAILDAKGKVVRHLAAGVLGAGAPAPLKKDSLSQQLIWDGKDDYGRQVLSPPKGKPAGGGPFRVRVSLGMKPVFDAAMFDRKQMLLGLNGLATGPGGELYIKGGGRDGGMGPAVDYRVYSPEGKYVRTVAPFPAGLEYDRVAGFGAFKVGQGDYIPRVHDVRTYSFYPVPVRGPRLTQMAVSKAGHLFFLSGGNSTPRICVVDGRGGVPAGWSFAGEGIDPYDPKRPKGRSNPKLRCEGFLAVGSQGKRVYISGISGSGWKRGMSIPAVFWTDIRQRGPAKVLCGSLAAEGAGEEGLKDPQGIAVDGKGHLLVADRGNGRVAVFSEAGGKLVASIALPGADKVQVDPKTGAVYVLTFSKKGSALVKFADWRGRKEVCRMSLGGGGAGRAPLLAVSSAAAGDAGPAVWVGSNGYRRYTLLRIPDLGDKFGKAVEVSPKAGNMVEDVFVDRLRNEVYVNLGSHYWRFKDGSDKAEKVPISVAGNSGLQLQVCPRGNIYGYAWGAKLHRWDHHGKPLPFEKTGKNILTIPSQMTYQLRGLFIDQVREEINIIQPNARRKTGKGVNPACFGSVIRVYDLEGKLKREPVRCLNFSACVGPRVDPAGNIYVGEPSRPNSHELPVFFKGKLPPIRKVSGALAVPREAFPYSWAYGSVVKFSPQGGSILWRNVAKHKEYKPWKGDVAGAADPVFYSQSSVDRIRKAPSQGVLWARMGFYPLTSRVGCNCLASYFDVDYFGRVFHPDAARSRVVVLDSAGNVICRFGRYGNRDAEGKGSYIPLAMGLAVAATDRHVYVGDINNQRLLRVKLTYAAEATAKMR